ncbi:MAG: glutamate--tRNA ligase family protein [Candidatus Hodgkinia cicadicola]
MTRVRIAPSPTGCPHLGNLLTGMYNLLFKLKYNADLVLRLEDTDVSRSGAVGICEVNAAFNSVGITFDESAIFVNKFGPYVQTQRYHIYNYYCGVLVSGGFAFWCKCKWRRVNALKRLNLALGISSVYDGKCLKLHLANSAKLRLKVPRFGAFSINKPRLCWTNVEMQPLRKRDSVTFHIASVVDDHLMRVSHVLRGRDWITSLAKHFLLNVYLRFKPPKFYHLPLLACAKGTKFSKRLLSCGVEACASLGILPSTIATYLASLVVGVSLNEFRDAVSLFSLQALNKLSLRVDKHRLLALNKQMLSRACLIPDLFELTLGCTGSRRALALCAAKSILLVDVYKQMSFAFCFGAQTPIAHQFLARRFVLISTLASCYKRIYVWNKPNLTKLHALLCIRLGVSLRTLLTLAYESVFNTRDSISLYDSFFILGKQNITFRLDLALNKLLA